MKLPKFMQPHTVEIKEYKGDSAYGPQFADPYEVEGYFQEQRKYVRSDEGDEVVSESQFFTSKDINVPQESEITFEGSTHKVINTSRKKNALNGQLTHVEIAME